MHWDQVNETQMPFLTMLKTGEVRGRQSEGLPTLTINAHVFIYMSAGMDPEDVPDTAMNALLDAVDAAVAPSGADALNGNKQTLGGLVAHCYSARAGVRRYRRHRRQGRRRDPVPDSRSVDGTAMAEMVSSPSRLRAMGSPAGLDSQAPRYSAVQPVGYATSRLTHATQETPPMTQYAFGSGTLIGKRTDITGHAAVSARNLAGRVD